MQKIKIIGMQNKADAEELREKFQIEMFDFIERLAYMAF